MNPKILYQDSDVLVLDKPAGVLTHEDGKGKNPSLSEWLALKFPEMKDVGDPIELSDGRSVPRSGVVHRLDKETSGVVVVARNQTAFDFLKKQFTDRTVVKKYLAFVWGKMKEERGMIDKPIGLSGRDFRRRSASRGAKGELREAVTVYRTLKSADGFSLVEVTPKTGRTHQIRVHFESIGRPVVGDKLYAAKKPPALGFKRLALHATSLSFELPSGKRLTVEAPLPADFEKAGELLANV